MACKISWTPKAWLTYEANIEYLKAFWTEKEISNFVRQTDGKINTLSNQPLIGGVRNNKEPNVPITLVHKRIALIYRFKPLKQEIELLVFWNTYQNPANLKIEITKHISLYLTKTCPH